MAKFISLASSSKANSYLFLNDKNDAVLLDCGLSFCDLSKKLCALKIDISSIKSVLITHSHSDHIAGLQTLVKKTGVPVFSSSKTASQILNKNILSEKNFKIIENDFEICGFNITPFKTSHDCDGSLGYFLNFDNKNVCFATDTGIITNDILMMLEKSDFAILEANHDVRLLKSGTYPAALKKRILSDKGHLSNDDCAKVLMYLAMKGLKSAMIAHLSENNNTPLLAKNTILKTLSMFNICDFKLLIAHPYESVVKEL